MLLKHRVTLNLKQQANGSASHSPRWSLMTTYNDWTVELEIDHHHASDEVESKLFVHVDGDTSEVVSHAELEQRRRIAKEYGDVYDDTHMLPRMLTDGVWKVRTELLARWEALQFIVSPGVNL